MSAPRNHDANEAAVVASGAWWTAAAAAVAAPLPSLRPPTTVGWLDIYLAARLANADGFKARQRQEAVTFTTQQPQHFVGKPGGGGGAAGATGGRTLHQRHPAAAATAVGGSGLPRRTLGGSQTHCWSCTAACVAAVTAGTVTAPSCLRSGSRAAAAACLGRRGACGGSAAGRWRGCGTGSCPAC